MKKLKIISLSILVAAALTACADNNSLMEDLNSASDNVVRFVNGTFSAQIENSNVKSVYDATLLALNNSGNYNIDSNKLKENIAFISGKVNSSEQDYNIKISKGINGIVDIYIKIGTFGDKQSSVDLLSATRTNLGL